MGGGRGLVYVLVAQGAITKRGFRAHLHPKKEGFKSPPPPLLLSFITSKCSTTSPFCRFTTSAYTVEQFHQKCFLLNLIHSIHPFLPSVRSDKGEGYTSTYRMSSQPSFLPLCYQTSSTKSNLYGNNLLHQIPTPSLCTKPIHPTVLATPLHNI